MPRNIFNRGLKHCKKKEILERIAETIKRITMEIPDVFFPNKFEEWREWVLEPLIRKKYEKVVRKIEKESSCGFTYEM